jgi:hypothetical protein
MKTIAILILIVIIKSGTFAIVTDKYVKIDGIVKIDSGAVFRILPTAKVTITDTLIINLKPK